MAEEQTIATDEQVDSPPDQQPQPQQQVPPARQLYDQLSKAQLYTNTWEDFQKKYSQPADIDSLYQKLNQAQLYTKSKDDFYDKYFTAQKPPPDHQVVHTAVHDVRHLNELANQPTRMSVSSAGTGAPGVATPDPEDVARNKGYQQQYEKRVGDLATQWGTDPQSARKALEDFPDEQDETKLKSFAGLAQQNPVYYGRLKDANDIRVAIAQNGPEGINDANVFNHLQQSGNYEDLQHNIALQQEIMTKHGLSQGYFEKLKQSQAPLINTLDPGLLTQYWNSDDKKLGLSDFQYAGLETEKMFNPSKYKQDVAILRQNRGLDDPGKGPVPQGKEGYAYDRGVENILYGLENQGRLNTSQYISQRTAELGPQIEAARKKYEDWIKSTNDPLLQQHFQQEFLNDPMLQEAGKLDDGQQAIEYARTEDQRRFPLNYGDQAARIVKDALSSSTGVMGTAGVAGKQVLLGAGETSDNTLRFIKNTFINLLGSDQTKAKNAAANIGHQALTELAGYEGSAFSMQQQPMLVDQSLVKDIQATFDDRSLSSEQKNQKAVELIQNHQDQIKFNPLAGQQNITGKAVLYSASNTIGQILGIADQSMLMGGLIGDASKAQQMASALVPMYATTQNQLYEQALARGEEKPLLRSHIDAAIISLASLINPDIKVVKGMVGAETGLGKLIAGVDESAWNKVLSQNKPLVDRMIAGTKATAKQLGLAGLQYGLVVPTAQYVVHKNVFNEDPNLADAIKDGLIQTSITMALPALFHGGFAFGRAINIDPTQKYAIVEAGVNPKQNIELIDQLVERGQITPDKADQIRQVIKISGDLLQNNPGVKSDGTWMTEQEVADVTFPLIKKKILEGQLKNVPDPQKPALEARLHELDQQIADMHTSETDKQKSELNKLLTDNLQQLKEKVPAMEAKVREAVRRNEPESLFQEIYDEASQTKKVEGKEVSLRADAEEKYGKKLVDKAFELQKQKTTTDGKETGPHDAQAGHEGQITPEKPQEGAAPPTTSEEPVPTAPSLIKPTSDKIQSTDVFRTWNLGDMEGKPENEAAKKHLEGVVRAWDQHPAGETGGETFGAFIQRVIPAFRNALETDANNTTIVTHSSVLKAMRVWDEMGRPEVETLTPEQKAEFADRFNAAETHNGDLESFKGTNGDIHVIRHGQTEDNAKNNFRSGNTNLTEKGVQDARAVGQELIVKTGGDVPKIITSDLPRTIHTSNLISDALQERSAAGVLQRPSEGAGVPGGERGGMEPGEQGQAPPGETGGQGEGKEPPSGAGGAPVAVGEEESRTVGIHHEALLEQAQRMGLEPPDRGASPTPAEHAARGRILILGGADPEKIAKKFLRTGEVSEDMISVARAHLEDLEREVNRAGDAGDVEGRQKAEEAYQKWANEIVKPMGNKAHQIMTSLQGKRDMDYGSFTAVQRETEAVQGKPLSEKQSRLVRSLTEKVQTLSKQNKDLQDKMSQTVNKSTGVPEPKEKRSYATKAKKAADAFRKLKQTSFNFKDENGNDVPVHTAGLTWNDLVEIGAKAIEKSGELADGLAAVLEKVKDQDWYKSLSAADKDRFGQELTDHYASVADKKAASRIKALEKQLADLQQGQVRTKGEARKPTAREEELKSQIQDQKERLGLVKPKATPQPKTPIEPMDAATHFAGKTGDTFTAQEAKSVWDHLKTNYLNKDIGFGDALRNTATDLGMTSQQVLKALGTPKGGRELTMEMWKKQYEQRKALAFAKRFVETSGQTRKEKFWNALPSAFFNLKTYGHGTVGNITHAGPNIFRPSVWKAYWPNVFKSFQLAYGSHGGYEEAVNELTSRPRFDAWVQAGLSADPFQAYDDYQVFGRADKKTALGKAARYLAEAGTKGFTGLKFMRYDMAESFYNRASDTERADPLFMETIAKLVNHATGHSEVKLEGKVGKVIQTATFAPGLEISRWQRMITDPAKAGKTFLNWKNATPAERAAAKVVAGGAAERLATYTALLAANAGLLAALGSKQKINTTNPLQSDWLRFKGLDKTLDLTGGVLGPIRLLSTIGAGTVSSVKGLPKGQRDSPSKKDIETIGQQLRYKVSPIAGSTLDVVTGQDAVGNVMPWSKLKPEKGRIKYSWAQFGAEQLPIPLAAGIKDAYDNMRERGATSVQANDIISGLIQFGVEGFTGAKLQSDLELQKQKEQAAGRHARK